MMRKLLYFVFFVTLGIFYSCNDDEYVTYNVNEPVFMPADEFRNSVRVLSVPKEIEKQGKICFYNGYLYISQPQKGIHIIDNRNPSNPRNVGFVELIGNADLSVRNNVLYADSYVDLVWFDIVNPESPKLRGRLENVFEGLPMPENRERIDYNMCYTIDGKLKGIVVGWTLKKRKEKIETTEDIMYNSPGSNSSNGNGNGKVGSMSRFGLYKDYLYSVINNQLFIFNIVGDAPQKVSGSFPIGWNVETIFSYKDNLFFGTPTGMLIYSVTDPLKPEFQSSLQHVYGCDPVVVENDLAYVTIHSGNLCGQNNNELFVIDVSDVKNPKQIVSYTMKNPKGLGIDDGTLFVCDDGLKIFNAAEPQKIMSNILAHYEGMDGFDVIPYNNVLMMIADDGLYQYDYSDLRNIRQLSKLQIKK